MANLPETPQWSDGVYQIETSDPVLGGPDGISNRQAKQLASRTSYLKQQLEQNESELKEHTEAKDPHPQYAPKASPVFTGTPTAPTPAQDANNTQIATTAFVQSLANAANNNANTRLEKNKNGADILDKPAFVKNLGLTAGSALPVGVPIPWPLATPPAGWIKCNGATFTAAQYPELARVYPSLRLPDLRGEFIRGWDDSGKIDPGRALLSLQSGSVGRHDHAFNQTWGATGPDSTGGRYPVSADTNGAALDLPIYTDYYGGNETRPRNIAFNYIVRAV